MLCLRRSKVSSNRTGNIGWGIKEEKEEKDNLHALSKVVNYAKMKQRVNFFFFAHFISLKHADCKSKVYSHIQTGHIWTIIYIQFLV